MKLYLQFYECKKIGKITQRFEILLNDVEKPIMKIKFLTRGLANFGFKTIVKR